MSAPAQRSLLLGSVRPVELLSPCPFGEMLTVDVEEWYHVNYRSAGPHPPPSPVARVAANTQRILDLLDATGSRATFFVLGEVARDHPQLVREIAARGHEVACHSLGHDLVYHQSAHELRTAAAAARALLEDTSGTPVRGFRAPSWSITERALWAFDVLREVGFRYDSSVFPVANYLYGIAGAPRHPYWIDTPAGRLLELPPPVWQLGPFRIPHGGGFYLRMLPLWIERLGLFLARRARRPTLLYLHPREVDPAPPRLPLSMKEAFIQDFGHRGGRRKIARLVGGRRWTTVWDVFSATLAVA